MKADPYMVTIMKLIETQLNENSFYHLYADNKGPDITAHKRSLIKVFIVRLQND